MCPVVQVTIEDHPNADRLEIAKIEGYNCVVGKDQFETGDRAVYIPEGSIVPDNILEDLGLTGMLHGSKKNRVKAAKIRKVLSQGLLYPITESMEPTQLGSDMSEELGITKFDPPLPSMFKGTMVKYPNQIQYDIENIKRYPYMFDEGESVLVTEKIHGTLCRITFRNGEYVISSKGIGNRGFAFSKETRNIYTKTCGYFIDLFEELENRLGENYTIFGEVYGKGIQDLSYNSEITIRIFDIYDGKVGKFLDVTELIAITEAYNIPFVPSFGVYEYSQELIETLTSGKSLLDPTQIREGIVIKPLKERNDDQIGRVILKSVAENYLLREKATEIE